MHRSALAAAGPLIGIATVITATRGTGTPGWIVDLLVVVAGVGLWIAGTRGGEVVLAIGLGAVGVAAATNLFDDRFAPDVVLWTAGAVAAGEATALAGRRRSLAVPDAAVASMGLAWAAGAVAASVVVGVALVLAGMIPGPGGVVGEIVALGAVIVIGAVAATPRRTARPGWRR